MFRFRNGHVGRMEVAELHASFPSSAIHPTRPLAVSKPKPAEAPPPSNVHRRFSSVHACLKIVVLLQILLIDNESVYCVMLFSSVKYFFHHSSSW